jgi:hypothetical protein
MSPKHFKMLIEPVNTDRIIFILWVTIEGNQLKLNLIPINSKFRRGPTLLGRYPLNDYTNTASAIFSFVVGYIPADISKQTREELKKFSNKVNDYIKGLTQ